MSLYGQKPSNVSHHPTEFCGFRHCGSGDILVLVCHVVLKDHVIKVLKSAITIFSKAHGMSYSHIRNFTIKAALTKTFACMSNEVQCVNTILHSNWWNIGKKTFVGPSKNGDRKQKERKREKKAIAKLFALHASVKISFRNKQYFPYPYYVKVPRGLISWDSRKKKSQIIRFFSGTSYGGDRHRVTFTTSNISLHLTVTCSRLENELKVHSQVWDNFWQINAL